MAERLDCPATVAMLKAVAQSVIDRTDLLTDADLAIGDGDHGIGMRRGFEGALEALATEPATIEAAFKAVGNAILSKTGGAAGAVFGTLFRAGAKPLAGAEALDAAGFSEALAAGLQGVMARGGCGEGQKTMIDAVAPASRAAAEAVPSGLAAATAAAAVAARAGAEKTKDMIATTGKARSLGERSLGHPDPGAVSVTLILQAMADFVARA